MFSFFPSLLSYLPFNLKRRLIAIRARCLLKWYHYFPTPTSRHMCRVCRETLQGKSGESAADGFLQPSSDLSGQQQFETYGQVTCPCHISVQSLRNSANDNCTICSRVWSSVGDDLDQRKHLLEALDLGDDILTYCYITETAQVDTDLWTRGRNNSILVSVGFPERVSPDASQPATFVLLPSQQTVVSTHWRLPSYSTGSAQSWYVAKFWYETYLKNHENCNRKRRDRCNGSQWYPTRLIKILRWSRKLRLVLTEKERPGVPYLTLSHCWGKAYFIQLTQSSLSDFQKNIPYSELPKTFRDAVSMAQSLRIYYIWIDSLCIIQRQESLTDWKLEAAEMECAV